MTLPEARAGILQLGIDGHQDGSSIGTLDNSRCGEGTKGKGAKGLGENREENSQHSRMGFEMTAFGT